MFWRVTVSLKINKLGETYYEIVQEKVPIELPDGYWAFEDCDGASPHLA